MPLCKNCPKNKKTYYTGKEKTPRGRGYCAAHENEGKRMKGRDGKMYRVKGNRWVLSKSASSPKRNRSKSPRLRYLDDMGKEEFKKAVFDSLCNELIELRESANDLTRHRNDQEKKEHFLDKYDKFIEDMRNMSYTYDNPEDYDDPTGYITLEKQVFDHCGFGKESLDAFVGSVMRGEI